MVDHGPAWLASYAAAALAGAVLAVLVRSVSILIYRKWFRQGMVWDAAFHFAVVRTLKRTGRYEGVDEFLMKNKPDTYPKVFHRFAAVFPLRLIEKYPFLPNLLIYALSSAVFGGYVWYVGGAYFPGRQLVFCAAAGAFHLLSVSNITFNGNAILYLSFAERQLGRIACGWYFLALGVALTFQDSVSLVIAGLSGGLAAISSMFARQAIFFTTPLLALYLLDATPLAVLASAFVLALVVDRGYFLRGLAQMAEFWEAYARFTKRSAWVKPSLSRFANFRMIFGRVASLSQRVVEMEGREPTKLLFAFPELFLVLAFCISASIDARSPFVATILATVTVYLLTSLKAFNHFGEAARYIEFNLYLLVPVFLATFVAGGAIDEMPVTMNVYWVWTALVVARQFLLWSRITYPGKDELAEFLLPLKLTPSETVFPIPFTLGPGISVRTSCRAITYQGSAVNVGIYEKFTQEVPFLKREWWGLFDEYRVTHVIGLASAVNNLKDYLGWEYDVRPLVKIAESKDFVAFRVPSRDTWPSSKTE